MVSKKNNKTKSNYTIFIIIIIIIIINFKNDILNLLNLDTNLFGNFKNMFNNLLNTLLNILGINNVNSNTKLISNLNNNPIVNNKNKNKANSDKNNIPIKKIINEVKKEENKENIDPEKAVKLGEIHQYGLYEHKVDPKIAIDYYLYALNNGFVGAASYNLAKLYYEGCQNIKPDVTLCIDYCLKGLQSGNFNCLLLLGTLYHRGIHPYYQPNRIAAKEIFEFIINNSESNKNISKELVNNTHERLIEINKEDNQEHTYNSLSESNAVVESFDDNEGGFLPGDILFQIQNFMPKNNPMNYDATQKYIGGKNRQNFINESNNTLNNITNVINNTFNNGINGINNQNLNTNDYHNVPVNNYNNNNTFNIFDTNENANNMYQEALLQDILNNRINANTANNAANGNNNTNVNRNRNNEGDLLDIWINNTDINNDSQNVHDHNLLDYAVKSINNLKNLDTNYKNYDIHELRNNLTNSINRTNISTNEKKNAINVANRILNNNRNEHSRLKITEADLLNLVLNRINKHPNSEDLHNNLIQNLTSGVEKGFVVCGTGRMMRILGALDNLDKDNLVELKPSWALKEEISNTINKIRDTELSKCSSNVKNQYDSGEDTNEVNNLLNNIKEKVKNKCLNDYVKNGLISESELNLKLEPLLNGL